MFICNSPWLFAACHVLLRRLVPRHPPYALISLIIYVFSLIRSYLNVCSCLFSSAKYLSWIDFRITLLLSLDIFKTLVCSNSWVLLQISLCSCQCTVQKNLLVGLSRLELPTSRLSGACSNQLSYNPILVEVSGFEPLTPCLQSRCSTNWAIPPRYMPDKNDTSPAKKSQFSRLSVKTHL